LDFLHLPREEGNDQVILDPITKELTAVTATEVAINFFHLSPMKIDKRVQMEISRLFKQLGWTHDRRRVGEKRLWYFIRPNGDAVTEIKQMTGLINEISHSA
jgi:hypothetical protein